MNKLILILLFTTSLLAQDHFIDSTSSSEQITYRDEKVTLEVYNIGDTTCRHEWFEKPPSFNKEDKTGGMSKFSNVRCSNERICLECYRHEKFIIKSVYHDLYEREKKEWKKLVERIKE